MYSFLLAPRSSFLAPLSSLLSPCSSLLSPRFSLLSPYSSLLPGIQTRLRTTPPWHGSARRRAQIRTWGTRRKMRRAGSTSHSRRCFRPSRRGHDFCCFEWRFYNTSIKGQCLYHFKLSLSLSITPSPPHLLHPSAPLPPLLRHHPESAAPPNHGVESRPLAPPRPDLETPEPW